MVTLGWFGRGMLGKVGSCMVGFGEVRLVWVKLGLVRCVRRVYQRGVKGGVSRAGCGGGEGIVDRPQRRNPFMGRAVGWGRAPFGADSPYGAMPSMG